jgi:hypothetical protein
MIGTPDDIIEKHKVRYMFFIYKPEYHYVQMFFLWKEIPSEDANS